MTNTKGTIKYEFSENENLILSALSGNLRRLGIVVLVAGLLFVAYLVVSFLDPVPLVSVSDARSAMLGTVDYGLWAVIAILVIYLSATVIRLAGPVGQIVKTRGADITHLMHFVQDLTRMIRVSFFALIAVCLLLALSLVFLILIF
ncbi:MAG: hypothetical protein A4E58_01049 [Syntrophorhabdus sp. PtaB.Bin006]|nr:MAG: hypothetical protein A4E58_01049 [Syntrophorhabdus sp. PtaB.Bin006]